MFSLLNRLLFGPHRPQARMTEQEVRALADRAAHAAHIDRAFSLVVPRSIDGRLTWVASTPTVGSGWSVTIDDATGEIGPVRRWGIR